MEARGFSPWLAFVIVFSFSALAAAQVDAPRIFLDQPERIVEYQLNRLTRDQLVAVERLDTDVRYRPVYLALLTREGIPLGVRHEAVAALVKLGAPSASHVLLTALGKIPAEGGGAVQPLTRQLLSQPLAELSKARDLFLQTGVDALSSPQQVSASYGALLAIAPDVREIWAIAAGRPDHLRLLLESVPSLATARTPEGFRPELARLIVDALALDGLASDARAAAVLALGQRSNAATATVLAGEIRNSRDARVRESAATALHANSALATLVPAGDLEPVIGAIEAWVTSLEAAERTRAPVLDALALGQVLASRLPAARALRARRSLRALGAQVVRITALPEQVSFDRRWFAVEAGRPVQIVLVNPDAMPHNVVVGRPGSLERIGTAAAGMSMPQDPAAKPFVPDLPDVLFSTRLAQQDETLRLVFTSPKEPGAYVFACTFPGHWVRMYGVMLVVTNLEAWEAAPTVPNDPMTGHPFPPP